MKLRKKFNLIVNWIKLRKMSIRRSGVRIHPDSTFKDRVEIGRNSYVRARTEGKIKIGDETSVSRVSLVGPIKIGNRCRINNVKIFRYTYCADNVEINHSSIGSFCSIGPNTIIGLAEHPISGISTSPVFYSDTNEFNEVWTKHPSNTEFESVEMADDVWVGANVCIKGGVKIGTGAVIGAGAVVTKNVSDYEIVIGVPARSIGYRLTLSERESIKKTLWWEKEIQTLKEIAANSKTIEEIMKMLNRDVKEEGDSKTAVKQ